MFEWMAIAMMLKFAQCCTVPPTLAMAHIQGIVAMATCDMGHATMSWHMRKSRLANDVAGVDLECAASLVALHINCGTPTRIWQLRFYTEGLSTDRKRRPSLPEH